MLWAALVVVILLLLMFFGRRRSRSTAPNTRPQHRTAGKAAGRVQMQTLQVGGIDREYLFHAAPPWASRPVPLVLALHGGQGHAAAFALQTGLSRLGRREGFAVVYPNALEQWKDGRSTTRHQTEDIDFIDTLLDYLMAQQDIDPNRVFAVGASSGGMFTLRLACERSQRFSACVAVSAALPVGYECPNGPGMPLLLINGTDDRLIPWEGGEVGRGPSRGVGGQVRSVPDTVRFWQSRNRCGRASSPERLAVPSKPPVTAVERFRFEPCANRCALELVKVHGGGHQWPGAPDRAHIGKPDAATAPGFPTEPWATDLVWSFLRARSAPDAASATATEPTRSSHPGAERARSAEQQAGPIREQPKRGAQ